MNEKEKIEKQFELTKLYDYIPEFLSAYFDYDSEKLLDEKIKVLTKIKNGKTIDETPNFYNIFELLPSDGIWD